MSKAYERQKERWEKRRSAMQQSYDSGKTVKEIASAYRLTTQRVYAIIKTKEKAK